MAFTYGATKNQIEASATEEKMKLISEVLPPASYDNLLLDDYAVLGPTRELGLTDGGRVYRARQAGIKRLFVLTTRTEHWFVERGFKLGTVDDLPAAKKEMYNYQRRSKVLFKTL